MKSLKKWKVKIARWPEEMTGDKTGKCRSGAGTEGKVYY